MWELAQWKRTCCSSWTSSVLHRSQVGELHWFHVAVSKRRVWTQSLKQAVLRMTSRGRLRNMCQGRMSGEWVTRALFVGRAYHWWYVERFTIVFSQRRTRKRCPILQVSLPEVYDKTAEINLKIYDLVRPSMAERIWADQQAFDRVLNCMSAVPLINARCVTTTSVAFSFLCMSACKTLFIV